MALPTPNAAAQGSGIHISSVLHHDAARVAREAPRRFRGNVLWDELGFASRVNFLLSTLLIQRFPGASRA
jgi:hypothetical protein